MKFGYMFGHSTGMIMSNTHKSCMFKRYIPYRFRDNALTMSTTGCTKMTTLKKILFLLLTIAVSLRQRICRCNNEII